MLQMIEDSVIIIDTIWSSWSDNNSVRVKYSITCMPDVSVE